jgi:sodium-dependent dicarboxylate transporter 2/3/5
MLMAEDAMSGPQTDSRVAWAGRLAGPVLAIGVYLLLGNAADLTPSGRSTAAVGTLMAVFWMTEALPLPVTSLLPLVLFPLCGVLSVKLSAAPYANPLVFLFLGGFLIALAIERWNLHRRIALLTVLAVGTNASRLIAGFMLATAFLSMWISNTATTVMMLPIGLSVIALVAQRPTVNGTAASDGQAGGGVADEAGGGVADEAGGGVADEAVDASRLAVCLLLGIAYAANIGGLGTLVGTPPNLILAGFAREIYGIEIGFARWMGFALPLVAVFLVGTWVLLTRVIFPLPWKEIPGSRELIRGELAKLGRMSRGEWTVTCVFVATALAWVIREPVTHWQWLLARVPAVGRLDDTLIALIGAILLFMIPVDARAGVFPLNWAAAKRLPWGVLLLFGGGLSLAEAVASSQLGGWIGSAVHQIDQLPMVVIVVAVVATVTLLTEVTSNTATVTTFLPVVGGVAVGIGADPLLLLAPATLAASCAFMMPVATPPNAIVFGSGRVSIGQMVKAGVCLNLFAIVAIPLLMYSTGVWLLGIRL